MVLIGIPRYWYFFMVMFYILFRNWKWITPVVNKNRTHLSSFEWQASANFLFSRRLFFHAPSIEENIKENSLFLFIPFYELLLTSTKHIFLYLSSKYCQKYSVYSRKKWNTLTYDEEWNEFEVWCHEEMILKQAFMVNVHGWTIEMKKEKNILW